MSAIAAILRFDGAPVADGEIERLIGAMRHRGPDREAVWKQGSIALGHAMLHATPESLDERHPLVAVDGRFRMIWDGRLDNRDEIQRELASHRVLPRDDSDPELVLQLFLIHRERTAERLLGDFAYIIWDDQCRELYSARDVMGARSLCFALKDKFVVFATDEDALTAISGVEMRANRELIASLFLPGLPILDETRGWNENAIAVGPGHQVVVNVAGRLRQNSFRTLAIPKLATFRNEVEAATAFVSVFQEALRCRMRSHGNFASLMSGGMDSAAIIALASGVLQATDSASLATFSALSPIEEKCVESDAIRAMATLPHLAPHFLFVPSLAGGLSVAEMTNLAWGRPHPVDNCLLLVLALGTLAKAAGNRVLLHAAAGDLTAHSPGSYIATGIRSGNWIQAWRESRLASRHHTYLRHRSFSQTVLRNLFNAYAPTTARSARARLRYAFGDAEHEFGDARVLSLSLRRRLDLPARFHDKVMASIPSNPCDWRNAHLDAVALVRHGLAGFDRTASRLGLETRDPWGDCRVVDFFLSLPLGLKVAAGRTKYLVRKACEPFLPPGVPWRTGKEHIGWKLTKCVMDVERPNLIKFLTANQEVLHSDLNLDVVFERANRFVATGNLMDMDFCYNLLTFVRWRKLLPPQVEATVA